MDHLNALSRWRDKNTFVTPDVYTGDRCPHPLINFLMKILVKAFIEWKISLSCNNFLIMTKPLCNITIWWHYYWWYRIVFFVVKLITHSHLFCASGTFALARRFPWNIHTVARAQHPYFHSTTRRHRQDTVSSRRPRI